MGINEEMRRILLAGIGAVATTAEKSKEIVDALVEKGELTVEQGKAMNEELKRNLKDSIKSSVNITVEKTDDLMTQVESLTPEQRKELQKKLAEMETAEDGHGEGTEE